MNKFLSIILLVPLYSCYYGVNKESSVIGDLNTDCLSENGWEEIFRMHSVDKIKDSIFITAISEINDRILGPGTEILFFESEPKELIAISKNKYFIYYAFNPELSDVVMDGFSYVLNLNEEKEKKRITKRVQMLIMKYQCKKGRIKSLQNLETQW